MQALCACLGRFGNIAATQMPLLVNKIICSVSFHVYVIIYTKKVATFDCFSGGILVRIANSYLWHVNVCGGSCDDARARHG